MQLRHTRLLSCLSLLILVWSTSALAVQAHGDDDFELHDFAVPNGWYYTQTGSDTGNGYAITDRGGITFWSSFRQLGGVPALGYPVSGRFIIDGFVYQATQNVLLQWDAASSSVKIANTFDLLSDANYDSWLEAFRQIPRSFDWSADDPFNDWEGTVQNHLTRIFEAQPGDTPELSAARIALKERFLSNPDWLLHYGLPLAIQDFGSMIVMRAQRVALQYWNVSTDWGASPGDVTVVHGGDLAKEAGLIPDAAAVPKNAALATVDANVPSTTTQPSVSQPTPSPVPTGTTPSLPIERIATNGIADQLSIVGSPTVISSPHGNFRIYVQLRNDAATTVSTGLEVLALDASGAEIGHASGDVVALLPGSTRAVRLLSNDPFATPASLELRFTSTLAGVESYEREISFSGVHYEREGNLHALHGSVTNNGARPYSLDLGGALFDSAGSVLGMAIGLVSNLLPGETREFMLTTAENVQGVASHTVAVNVIIPK